MAEPESNGTKPRTPEEEKALRSESRREAAAIEYVLGNRSRKQGVDPALRPDGARKAIETVVAALPEVRGVIDAARRLAYRLSRRLGHSTAAVTETIYLRWIDRDDRGLADLMGTAMERARFAIGAKRIQRRVSSFR